MPDNIAFEPDEGRAVSQGEGGEGGSGGSSGEQLYRLLSSYLYRTHYTLPKGL